MKSFLQLTRAHTAPLEIVPAILGAAFATGTLFDSSVLLWGVYGLLYHLAGYGMNSYIDWSKGYDDKDVYKSHHPLNTGAISENRANMIVTVLFGSVVFYAMILIKTVPAFLMLVVGVAGGVFYNYYGKKTPLKFVFISIAHMTVFSVPYLNEGGEPTDMIFIWGSLYVLLWVMFQISVSGEVKDVMQDESNLLKTLGTVTRVGTIEMSSTAMVYSFMIKLASFNALLLLAYFIGGSIRLYLLIGFVGLVSLKYTAELIKSGDYEREKRVRDMSLIEMTMIIGILVAAMPIIGFAFSSFIFAYSVIWVILFNLIEWGTVLTPKV